MQRYRKEVDKYKQQMILDTAIGRASLEGRIIRVSGIPEISYQLPPTMKTVEAPQAPSPDIEPSAAKEASDSKDLQSAPKNSFPKQRTQQAFSGTNSSTLESPYFFQEWKSNETRGSFPERSRYIQHNEQTQQGPSGRNAQAEENSLFLSKVIRLDPFNQSYSAATVQPDLQSSLSSLTQRQEAIKYNRIDSTLDVSPSVATNSTYLFHQQMLPVHQRNAMEADFQSSLPFLTERHDATIYNHVNSNLEVNPSVPTNLTNFLQQQLLPAYQQNAIRYVESISPPIASLHAMTSEDLSPRVLQMLLHSARDNHMLHTNCTTAPTQHQPEFVPEISSLHLRQSVFGM